MIVWHLPNTKPSYTYELSSASETTFEQSKYFLHLHKRKMKQIEQIKFYTVINDVTFLKPLQMSSIQTIFM